MVSRSTIVSLSLVLLSMTASAITYPQYTCASLGTNIAASYVSSNNYQVNSNGCQSGYQALIVGVTVWTALGSTGTYTCTAVPTTTTTTTTTTTVTNVSYACQTKQANKNFSSGASLVYCTGAATDCALADSSYGSCLGVVRSDGKGICVPVASNTNVFQGYWNACGSSNSISNANTYAYWAWYIAYWPYTQTDLTCTGFFYEIQLLASLLASSQGEMLTVGVLALLALIN